MRFPDWYGSMLRSLMEAFLPEALAALWRRPGAGVVVMVAPDMAPHQARLMLRRRGGDIAAGTLGRLSGDASSPVLAASRQGVVIRLAPDPAAVLTRTATLPLAAERDLATAITHEMDRLSPFDAAEVWFRAEPLRRDREQGKLLFRLTILPRFVLAPVIDALAGADLVAGRIEVAVAGRLVSFPLDGVVERRQTGRRGLVLLCAVLALGCVTIPLWRQHQTLMRLAAERQAIAGAVRQAEALRERMNAARAGVAAIGHERQREGDMLAALASITTAVPDGSFLTDITIRHRIATIDGESPDAAGLVARLSADRAFADPSFAAPVTRALNAKADIFAIRAKLTRGAPR